MIKNQVMVLLYTLQQIVHIKDIGLIINFKVKDVIYPQQCNIKVVGRRIN